MSNRWKFKKKFWIWHRQVTRAQGLQFRHGLGELPSLFTHLVRSGLFSSLPELVRTARFGVIALNGKPATEERQKLQLGDIVQLAPNLKPLLQATSARKNKIFKRLRRYKRTQRVVIQSQ